MTSILLTTLAYVFAMLLISVIGGVLRLHYLKRHQQWSANCFATVNDSVDKCLDDLKIENHSSPYSAYVPSEQGSCRTGLDQVMSSETFEELKAEEYSKNL